MLLNSLLEIRDAINLSIETALPQIKRVRYLDSIDQLDTYKAKDLPAIYYLTTAANYLENYNTVTIDFIFADAEVSINDSLEKDIQIKSDLFQYGSILSDYMQAQGYIGEPLNISTETFSGAYNNGLSGIRGSVVFNLSKPCYPNEIFREQTMTVDRTDITVDTLLVTVDET